MIRFLYRVRQYIYSIQETHMIANQYDDIIHYYRGRISYIMIYQFNIT